MRISSLMYFYEVAELKSISKVSNNLHISQPALSHQLSSLEKQLGVTILERSNRGVKLTEKGKILYNYSKEILKLHNSLLEELNMKSESKEEIKISVLSRYGNFLMDNIAKDLGHIFEDVNISISNTAENNEKSILLHDRADLVIGCKKIEDNDLVSEYIGSDRLILVGKTYRTCNELTGSSIAILNDNEKSINKLLDELNYLEVHLKTDSVDTIKSYIKNSNSAAIVPEIAVRKELKNGELSRLCGCRCSTEYNMYISYRKDISTNLKRKFKLLKNKLEDILKQEDIIAIEQCAVEESN